MAFVDTELRPAGEVQQKVGRIKLSEAIRIGARLRPQCTGVYGNVLTGSSCAIGAAWEAITGQLPWQTEPRDFPKVFGKLPSGITSEIFHRNDGAESRESIADWLESRGF